MNKKLFLSIMLNISLLIGGGYAEYKSHFYGLKLNNFIDLHLLLTDDVRAINAWGNSISKLKLDSVDVCFFGNSITRRSDFSTYFPEKSIVNLGYSGDDVENCIRRVEHIKAINPSKVFVMMGVNRLKYFSLHRFEIKYLAMVDSILAASPHSDIYLQSILPVGESCGNGYPSNEKIIKANSVIESIAKSKGITYINLFNLYYDGSFLPANLATDGVHINDEAYERWADAIKPYIYDK